MSLGNNYYGAPKRYKALLIYLFKLEAPQINAQMHNQKSMHALKEPMETHFFYHNN